MKTQEHPLLLSAGIVPLRLVLFPSMRRWRGLKLSSCSLIGARDTLKITFDLGLNGCPLDNKHATGFRQVYPGLDRVA